MSEAAALPPPLVLYEQGPCFVVYKPAGLLTQAPPGIDSLEARMKAWIKVREGKSGNVYLGVPHRLDRPVSGAVVFARHVRAARRIAEQFEARTVRKLYWACVEGVVEPAEGSWRDRLAKLAGQARVQVVEQDDPQGKPAVLDYRTLGRTRWGAWLEMELHTGRMHQIRVQCSVRGHPVLGDAFYGATTTFGPQHEDERLRAIALHARQLELRHPMTHEPVSITAPLPEPWRSLGLELGEADYLPLG